MRPPIYSLCAADATVKSLLGDPPRLYPFGEADEGTTTPYAVYQIISGSPENYLTNAPDADHYTVQVDVYSDVASEVEDSAEAIRDAVETQAHVTAWRGTSKDQETKNYRYSFDVAFVVSR